MRASTLLFIVAMPEMHRLHLREKREREKGGAEYLAVS